MWRHSETNLCRSCSRIITRLKRADLLTRAGRSGVTASPGSCFLPARRSCRLSFAVLIVLVCPGSSIYVNWLLRLEHRVSLLTWRRYISVQCIQLCLMVSLIISTFCVGEEHLIMVFFLFLKWFAEGKGKGKFCLLICLILLFCRLFLRPLLWGDSILLCWELNSIAASPTVSFAHLATLGLFHEKKSSIMLMLASALGPPVYFRICFRVSVLSTATYVSAANQPHSSATLAMSQNQLVPAWAESLKSGKWATFCLMKQLHRPFFKPLLF